MPDITFASLDLVPEGLKEHTKQVDGKFVVNVVPNAKLTEFRDNNIKFAQERDAAKALAESLSAIVGSDIEKFKTELNDLRTTAQKVKDGQLKGSEAVTKEVEARLEAAVASYKTQLAEMGTKASTYETASKSWQEKYERQVLREHITAAVVAKDSIANPAALGDIIARAEQVFRVKDGGVVPMKGDTIIYGADGANPMTPKEWINKLVESAPYFGKESSGGGAGAKTGDAAYGGLSQEAFMSLTPEERITRSRMANR